MNSSCLKVTVNGKKFLITGIRKEVLRKDLLCALAKTSDETFQQLKHGGLVPKQHECVSDELSKSTSDENLLTLLKGDRETAGDYESLKILNSLGKNAKIIKRGSDNRGQIKDLPPLIPKGQTTKERKHHRSKKKYARELNVDKPADKRPEKCTRISKRVVSKTSTNTDFSPKHSSTKDKHAIVVRSVDDSDIDSYKQTKLNKLRKRQTRCYDDSDIDIYNSLYDIVLDQNKKLHNTQAESKQFIKRTSWLEDSLKVYYIDDINSHKNNNNNTAGNANDDNNSNIISSNNSTDDHTMNTSASIYEDNDDVDNDNDSGLPSPEYDSSESTDNQPIRLQRTITRLQNKSDGDNISVDQNINTVIKNAYIKNKQNKDINENITLQRDLLKDSGDAVKCKERMCKTEGNNLKVSNFGTLKSGKLANYNEDVYLQRRSKSLGDLLLNSRGESTQQTSLNSETDVFSFDITNGLGLDDEVDEEKVRYILKNLTNDKIINMGVLNPAFLNSTLKSKKKLEKKKINKADISEPQLLSPTQFRRYGSLKNVQTAAMLLKNGINGMGRSVSLPTGEKDDERKDKEKFYNKKLMEVRRSKRSSKSSGKGDSSSSQGKTKEKEKLIATDKPPGDKKSSRTNEKRHSKERDKHKHHDTHEKLSKDKKDMRIHKHRDELKYNTRHVFKREKSFDTTTTTTSTTDPNDDTRSCSSSTGRSSSTEPDIRLNKKELDIIDIEKQIIELNKLKSQQKSKECTSEKYICQTLPNETSSLLDDSNMVDSNDEADYHLDDEHDNNDDDKNEKCVNDDALETTSDYSSLNENIKLESIDDVDDVEHIERTELIALYTREEAAVNELIEKILDYNLLIEALSEELDILKIESDSNQTTEDLIAEEENIYTEIDSVRGLLQSVIDLCAYQRKEMSENLALLDKLDTKVRTKKAGYEILRSGEWRTNSNLAPRSLLKYSKEKKATNTVKPNPTNPNSSVV